MVDTGSSTDSGGYLSQLTALALACRRCSRSSTPTAGHHPSNWVQDWGSNWSEAFRSAAGRGSARLGDMCSSQRLSSGSWASRGCMETIGPCLAQSNLILYFIWNVQQITASWLARCCTFPLQPSRVTLGDLSQGFKVLQTPARAHSCPTLHWGMQQRHSDLRVMRSPAKANSRSTQARRHRQSGVCG